MAAQHARMVTPSSTLTAATGALLVAAGVVHGAAAGSHAGDPALVQLFAGAAILQGGIGVVLLARPHRWSAGAALAVSLAAVATWAASRTTGLPISDALAEPESVSAADAAATALELAAVVTASLALRGPAPRLPKRGLVAVGGMAVVLVAAVGLTASHGQDGHDGHDPEVAGRSVSNEDTDHEDRAGHEDDAGHEGQDVHDDGTASLASDPIFAGADTAGVAEEELVEAKALIEATRAAIGNAFDDTASVTAKGYVSIGDGRRPGSFEHYIHPGYLADGRELDPHRIESLVFENTGDGSRLVSAMYILETGSTMHDVPPVAGDLALWHDHQNLCWDETGVRLAGVEVEGRCVPGGTLRPTAPMLHVWLDEHPCGPFAGIEGQHGQGCAHDAH